MEINILLDEQEEFEKQRVFIENLGWLVNPEIMVKLSEYELIEQKKQEFLQKMLEEKSDSIEKQNIDTFIQMLEHTEVELERNMTDF